MEYTLFFPADASGYAFYPEASFATLEEAITAAADTADAYVEHPTIGGTAIVYRTVNL
jgi:hypothetical protein